MKDISAMTRARHIPVIPTLQWFCAEDAGPMIIHDTLTVHDTDHLTQADSSDLSGVFRLALTPILRRDEHGTWRGA